MTALYLQVALPVPLRRTFDYLPPRGINPANLPRGIRVSVPFGRQTLVGLLLGVSNTTTVPANKLKHATEILDQQSLLPEALLELMTWAADYYQSPVGEALLSVLPTLLREGEAALTQTETWWRLTTHGKGLPEGALKRSPKQAALLQRLQQGDLSRSESKTLEIASAIFRELKNKQLIESYEKEIGSVSCETGKSLLAETPLSLNDEQRQAVTDINAAKKFAPFLLQGVTGSGKTEVYLQVIENTLKHNKQALVLVPEIGLTPQTIDRFRKRFHKSIVAFHSGLNNRERLDAWLQASRSDADIVIGTRSAIFTPMPNLGVIIIDEEHDSSFKQQDGFRYHARDVAMVRAQKEDIPIILGSATPCLESLRNTTQGRYQRLTLHSRAGGAIKPRLQLLDIAHEKLQQGFSSALLDLIKNELAQQNQVLVFLNRRGYAPVLMCSDCGWIANCVHCDARLTVHKQDRQLRCHHCGWQSPLPRHCNHCHSPHLDVLGLGTQRSEEILQDHFPDARIIRIDRDSTSRKNSLQELLVEVHSGEPAILVGTQMLAKGHHFPDVTLVAILDADSGMFSADFRSSEKLAQLLTQVAGRAGRAEKTGHVVIQSRFCDHPLMQGLIQQDYSHLAQQLLAEREFQHLPPFRQQAILRAEAPGQTEGLSFLQAARQIADALLGDTHAVQIIGPVPSLMEKRAGYFRHELIFSTQHRPTLQKLLQTLAHQIEESAEGKKVRWAMDVDPV